MEIPLLLPTFSCSNWNLECWSLWREENRRTRGKTLGARTNNKPITNPSYVKYQPLEPISWRPGNLRDPKSCFVFYPDGFSKGLNIMQRSCQVKKKTSDCLGCQNLLIILMKSTLFSGTPWETSLGSQRWEASALTIVPSYSRNLNLKQSQILLKFSWYGCNRKTAEGSFVLLNYYTHSVVF